MHPKLTLMFVLVLAWSSAALGQPVSLFGDGSPLVFKEQELDRRFAKSRIQRLLSHGTEDPNCLQVIGGLLAMLSEIGPTLHKKDENFTLDPALLQAATMQLNNPRFPGNAYLAAMVRRVLIDGRLPPAWLEVATRINGQVRIIDLAKLRFLADGLKPIDSFYFSLGVLRERHQAEVLRSTTVATTSQMEFRDRYLDRDVAWGQLMLLDVGPERSRGRRKRGGGGGGMVAHLQWMPPEHNTQTLMLFAPVKKPPVVRVTARLAPRQYLDLYSLTRGKRLIVRGRLWDMNKSLTELQLRDALLFEERDWSAGAVLAHPQAVLQCPAARNELEGMAPLQPGGFAH